MAKATATRRRQQSEADQQKLLERVNQLDPSDLVKTIADFQIGLSSTLSDISTSASTKLQQLRDIETAIVAKQQRLTELGAIEKMQESIIAAQDEHDRQISLLDAAREDARNQWAREQEAHEYDVARRNQLADEQYEALVASHKRNEEIRQSDLERGWQEREAKLREREQELEDLRNRVASFDNVLKREKDAAVAAATSAMKKEHDVAMKMQEDRYEAIKRETDLQMNALRDQISRLEASLVEARSDVAAAQIQAQKVTEAALASASGRSALDALRQTHENPATRSGK